MAETMLYPTVKRFLEAAGFRVKGEVNGCVVVSVRDGEPSQPTIVDMKVRRLTSAAGGHPHARGG
jgi:hypothetical protein